MKGQINIEYIGAAILFFLGVGVVIFVGINILPEYQDDIESQAKYYEAQRVTTQMMATEGFTLADAGANNWSYSDPRAQWVDDFGLKNEEGELSKEKIERLSNSDELGKVNYTQFRNVADVENQYHFKFISRPVFEYNGSFMRTDPPEDPEIIEPEEDYQFKDNRVVYGENRYLGDVYRYLIVSEDLEYDRVYFSEDWNFTDSDPVHLGETVDLHDRELVLDHVTNVENSPGSFALLEKQIHEFGAPVGAADERLTIRRFDIMSGEPLEIEVMVW